MKLTNAFAGFTLGLVVTATFLPASAQITNELYPIDLPTVLRLAGAQNLDIQIARARLTEAEANRQIANEQFFPWLAPGIGYHRRDGLAQSVPAGVISDAHYQSYSPGVALAAQLEIGDAIYKSLAAKQQLRASEQGVETQVQGAICSAALGYYDLAKAKAIVEVTRQALETSQEYQQQLSRAVGLGIAFKGDEIRVETQTQDYHIAIRRAQEQEQIAGAELARLLHLDSKVTLMAQDSGLEPVTLFKTNASMSTLVEQALRYRPELKQSQALILAARASKNGAVYGPLIPSIGAQVFGGGLGGGPDGGPSNFGPEGDYTVGLSWRIGPGGIFDYGRQHANKARLTSAELGEVKVKDLITSEVVVGLARAQSLADQIALNQRKLVLTTEALRLSRERKQYGVGIVLEDIQAQQDLTQARSGYVSAVAEYNKAQYGLSRAVGTLSLP